MQPNQKYKFYQPTNQQNRDQQFGHIIDSLHHQQGSIIQLLNKYKSTIPGIPDQTKTLKYKKNGNETIDVVKKNNPRKDDIKRVKAVSEKRKMGEQIKLPSFRKNNMSPIAKRRQIVERYHLGKSLDQSEKNVENSQVSRKKNKKKSFIQSMIAHQSRIQAQNVKQKVSQSQKNQEMQELLKPIHQIPKPIPYQNKIQKYNLDSSESQQGQVPINFYERKYQQLLKDQCKEELNFLYWSNNTDNKQWTQELTNIFQRHDQQIDDMHKRMKIMQKFDEGYFAIQLYKK